jgi:hypothetical protein
MDTKGEREKALVSFPIMANFIIKDPLFPLLTQMPLLQTPSHWG